LGEGEDWWGCQHVWNLWMRVEEWKIVDRETFCVIGCDNNRHKICTFYDESKINVKSKNFLYQLYLYTDFRTDIKNLF